jgi:hypothetical protein
MDNGTTDVVNCILFHARNNKWKGPSDIHIDTEPSRDVVLTEYRIFEW